MCDLTNPLHLYDFVVNQQEHPPLRVTLRTKWNYLLMSNWQQSVYHLTNILINISFLCFKKKRKVGWSFLSSPSMLPQSLSPSFPRKPSKFTLFHQSSPNLLSVLQRICTKFSPSLATYFGGHWREGDRMSQQQTAFWLSSA